MGNNYLRLYDDLKKITVDNGAPAYLMIALCAAAEALNRYLNEGQKP